MAPKTANKAKAVLKAAKGDFAEALKEAVQQEAAADEQSLAEPSKPVLKRPASAVDDDEAQSQSKMLKRPAAAAAAAEEDDAEELEAEGTVDADEEEEASRVMKKPAAAAAAAAPELPAEEVPTAGKAVGRKIEALETAKATEADAVQAPTEQAAKREKPPKPVSRTQELINAVHSTIASIVHKASPAAGVKLHPAALTTFDEEGFPSTRTVIPHYIADDLTEVLVSSQAGTRKESELSANPKASLHFQDQHGKGGWATLKGQATLRPVENSDRVDIVLRPVRAEVMSYNANVMGDANGWKPATMIMTSAGCWRRTDTGAGASA